jgi:tetratricopeptide (TPR) repeat protein
MRSAALWLAVWVGVGGGCVARAPLISPMLGSESIELERTPFFPQERYRCGPAALATLLKAAGVSVAPDELVAEVYLPARRGSLQLEMLAAARRHGRIPYRISPELSALSAELRAGRPVLVLQNLGLDDWAVWHYAVVIGLDPRADRVLLRSGTTRRETMPAWRFLESWDRAGHWAMVTLRPGELPARPHRRVYLRALADAEHTLSPRALEAAYRSALGRWPADATARFGLARALHAAGDLEDAVGTYRTLLAAHPYNTAVLNNLALVLAEQGCLDRALEAIAAALARTEVGDPVHAAVLDTQQEILEIQAPGGSCPHPPSL